MPAAATKQKISEILAEAANPAKKAAVQTRTQVANDEKFANISANPFYAVFANKETAPSQKQAAIASLMTATEDKEKNRAAKAAYEEFMAWMQEKRQAWALAMVNLVDTKVFSELKKFYANMNNGVIEFNESLKDLTDILEGLDELRLEGKTLDAFAEIKKDGEEKARREKILKDQADKAHTLLVEKDQIERSIAQHGQDTRFLIGGLTKAARTAIAQLEIDARNNAENIGALAAERENTQKEFEANPPSQLGEKLLSAKDKLRQLLELSDEEHDGRQHRLVEAAKNFVLNTKADTASALEHLGGVGGEYLKMQDNAGSMRATVLITHEGMKDAKKASQNLFDSLNPAEGSEEGEIARMEREDKQAAIRDHVSALEMTSGDRISMLKDVTELNSKAISLRENNEQEMQRVRSMNLNGVSGTAERLVTVLNGVNSAALHQGAEMTQGSLDMMNRSTHDILSKGVIAHAVGMLEENDRLKTAIDELNELAEKTRQATAVTRQALSEGAQIRAENEAAVADLKRNMEEYLRSATVIRDDVAKQAEAPAVRKAAPAAPSPLFG
jgi:hypothetical protein